MGTARTVPVYAMPAHTAQCSMDRTDAEPIPLRLMSRRIEIELTSARADGTWTWRAAGAREPKGVLDGGILPGESKAGDVLKVEADFEIDGNDSLLVVAATQFGAAVRSVPSPRTCFIAMS